MANRTCAVQEFHVDNAPPALSFSPQDASDPESISVKAWDATSGIDPATASIEYRQVGSDNWLPLPTHLDGNRMEAHVDSLNAPPGNYEFRASAADAAGNSSSITKRDNGQPMVLEFPLRTATALSASLDDGADAELVPFRKAGAVKGRLRAPDGSPIGNAPVTVTETFAPGSLLDRRVRTVPRGPDGSYRSKLPGGPSRDVKVKLRRLEALPRRLRGRPRLRRARRGRIPHLQAPHRRRPRGQVPRPREAVLRADPTRRKARRGAGQERQGSRGPLATRPARTNRDTSSSGIGSGASTPSASRSRSGSR